MRRISDYPDADDWPLPPIDEDIDLASWGAEDVAYINPIETLDRDACAVISGDGHIIAIAESREIADEYCRQLGFRTVAVH